MSTRSHIGHWEFISSNMLPVEYSDTQLKTNHMFNIAHGSAPEYIKNHINITREPAHNNNNNNKIYLKSNIQKSSIDYKIDRILL